MKLRERIRETIERYGMLGARDKVLVAVSGGPDSVFLLHILNSLRKTMNFRLFVGHLDHGIRARESSKDARFVKGLAKSAGLEMVGEKLKSGSGENKTVSLEERLREKRYDFFKRGARLTGCNIVATAHTLDDQAETVLMRIIKGSSLKGVCGIHPFRREGSVRFVRPLIGIEKSEILRFLKENQISFRIDRTNYEERFLRNRIRNKVLPYLSKINPRIKRSLFNLAESLREDYEFIEAEKKIRKGLVKKKKSMQYFMLRDIMLQPSALRKEMIRDVLEKSGANIKKLTFRHWGDIDYLMRRKAAGKSIDLPGKIRVRRSHESIIVENSQKRVNCNR